MPNAAESVRFGQLLRRARFAVGLTQEGLAERTGLGVRSIQHLEAGSHLPHPETLERLLGALELSDEERNRFELVGRSTPRKRGASSPSLGEMPAHQTILDRPRHNLPAQLTSFVGRERERAEVIARLATARLLTLTGTGGCGKTRVALEVAGALVDTYPDGIWLVELALLADPTLVAPTIAAVVGVQEQPDRPLLTTLVDVLRSKRLLLILDNCEHLIDECARLADLLLRGCPAVQILATSREALSVAGEVAWRVPSLPTPPPGWQPTQPSDLGALTSFDGVRLFAERAQDVDPGFAVTEQNGPALAQICWRLDGIPLAIELAAARVRVMAAERIAARLDDQFRLLTGGSRTALPRQQTLRATIDWSHNLLSESERCLLRRLAVFVGGWSLEAAEAVCVDGGIDKGEVLDLLTQLVDKSLVQVEKQPAEERYRLLETIRQYARDRLVEAREAETVRDRHRDWFVALAERAEPELIGPAQRDWLDRLETDLANFRAALAWCLEGGGSGEPGLRLAGALWRLWFVRDHENEGLEWLGQVLAAPGAQDRTLARAKALRGIWEMSSFGRGLEPAEQQRAGEAAAVSLAICQELGDRAGAAWSMNMLGRDASDRGDFARAEVLLSQALALARENGARWAMAQTLASLGILAAEREDYPGARLCFEESIALFREAGDERAIAGAVGMVGGLALELGDYAAARLAWNECLAIARALRSRMRIGATLLCLGPLARVEGDAELSHACFEESLAIARDIGSRWLTGMVLAGQGWLARSEGDNAGARAHMHEALRFLQDSPHRGGITSCLLLLGVSAVEDGAVRRGARLLARADVRRGDFETKALLLTRDRESCDQSIVAARSTLGDDEFARAWAEGQAMTLEQAVAYALGEESELTNQ